MNPPSTTSTTALPVYQTRPSPEAHKHSPRQPLLRSIGATLIGAIGLAGLATLYRQQNESTGRSLQEPQQHNLLPDIEPSHLDHAALARRLTLDSTQDMPGLSEIACDNPIIQAQTGLLHVHLETALEELTTQLKALQDDLTQTTSPQRLENYKALAPALNGRIKALNAFIQDHKDKPDCYNLHTLKRHIWAVTSRAKEARDTLAYDRVIQPAESAAKQSLAKTSPFNFEQTDQITGDVVDIREYPCAAQDNSHSGRFGTGALHAQALGITGNNTIVAFIDVNMANSKSVPLTNKVAGSINFAYAYCYANPEPSESPSPEKYAAGDFIPDNLPFESFAPGALTPEDFTPDNLPFESFAPGALTSEDFTPEDVASEQFPPASAAPESFGPGGLPDQIPSIDSKTSTKALDHTAYTPIMTIDCINTISALPVDVKIGTHGSSVSAAGIGRYAINLPPGTAPNAKTLAFMNASNKASKTVAIKCATGDCPQSIPYFSTQEKANTISISQILSQSYYESNEFIQAVQDARAQNIPVVVSAGNEDQEIIQPSASIGAWPISSHNNEGHRNDRSLSASGSNYGRSVFLSAPDDAFIASPMLPSSLQDFFFKNQDQETKSKPMGVDLFECAAWLNIEQTTKQTAIYTEAYLNKESGELLHSGSGTSFSAPQVAATSAMLDEACKGLSIDEKEKILIQNSQEFPDGGCDKGADQCGAGMLNTYQSVLAAQASCSTPEQALSTALDQNSVSLKLGTPLLPFSINGQEQSYCYKFALLSDTPVTITTRFSDGQDYPWIQASTAGDHAADLVLQATIAQDATLPDKPIDMILLIENASGEQITATIPVHIGQSAQEFLNQEEKHAHYASPKSGQWIIPTLAPIVISAGAAGIHLGKMVASRIPFAPRLSAMTVAPSIVAGANMLLTDSSMAQSMKAGGITLGIETATVVGYNLFKGMQYIQAKMQHQE